MEAEIMKDEVTTSQTSKIAKKSIPKKPINFAKKVDQETAKLMSQLKDKLNKKNFGRSITDAEIIAKAIPLLGAKEFNELQEQTYSQQDRLKMAYEIYANENGKVTYEEFLAVLLKDLPVRVKKS